MQLYLCVIVVSIYFNTYTHMETKQGKKLDWLAVGECYFVLKCKITEFCTRNSNSY